MAEHLIEAVLAKGTSDQDNTTVIVLSIAEDRTTVAADEAPTRILKPEAAPRVAAMMSEPNEGVETTQRIVQPPAYEAFFRRHRGAVLGVGMLLMFLIGWLLRALLG